jgi:DNA-binding transcriptional MerR regulator
MDGLLTIGELAEASGTTVRALHHYDQIGLVSASQRTDAGHRRYTPADVRRLYQVAVLRDLGLPLSRIGPLLEADAGDLRHAVQEHLAAVEQRLELEHRLRRRLVAILEQLEDAGDVPGEELIDAMEVMARMHRYYTPEQLEELDRRRDELGEEGMAAAQSAWADLISELEAARSAGTDPHAPSVQALAARWSDMVTQFTGGDPGIAESLKRMYREEGAERASRGALSPELMEYVRQASAA